MYHHIIFFKFPEGTDQEVIDGVLAEMDKLRTIPTVRSFALGPSATGKAPDGWTHAAIMVFDDEKSCMEDFRNHPIHLDVMKNQVPLYERVIALDIVDN